MSRGSVTMSSQLVIRSLFVIVGSALRSSGPISDRSKELSRAWCHRGPVQGTAERHAEFATSVLGELGQGSNSSRGTSSKIVSSSGTGGAVGADVT